MYYVCGYVRHNFVIYKEKFFVCQDSNLLYNNPKLIVIIEK